MEEVARAIGADSRIGSKFLKAGPGFGGSCFQKDILNLVYLCGHYGLEEVAAYWQSVVRLNAWQQHRIAREVVQRLFGTVSGKRIAVLGFAFKANTNDTRESPAIRICRDLLEEGAFLAIYDPKVNPAQIAADLGQAESTPTSGHEYVNASFGERLWLSCSTADDACAGADAVVVLTEWQEFARLNWAALARLMRQPAWVFDTRGAVEASAVRAAGLCLWRLGSNSTPAAPALCCAGDVR